MPSKLLAVAPALLALASAQTYTSCNPLDKTCPSDPGLGAEPLSIDSFSSLPKQFTLQSTTMNYADGQAQFVISKQGDAPTLISDFYFFFGTVSVEMKASPGTGIVSSIVLESDDLDEIDWEFLGGNTAQAETNYFGKGNTTTYNRATYVPVSSPQTDFHNYTVDWTSEQIQWLIDGSVVRTLAYADANGGTDFPQTPMRLRIGTWAGGDPSNAPGTIQWAGGETQYNQGPFTAYMKSLSVTDASKGTAYSYNGNSGSWQSIQISRDSSAGASASAALSSAAATATSGSATSATPAANPSGVAVLNNGTANGTTGSASGTGNSTGSGIGSTLTPSAGSPASTSSSTAHNAASLLSRSAALAAAAAVVGFGMALM